MSTYKLILQSIEDYIEKCEKPYISELPYDRRTTDPNKLKERLLAIDEAIEQNDEMIGTELWVQEERQNQIDELKKQNEDWQNQINKMTELEDEFISINQGLKQEGIDKVDTALKDLETALDGAELPIDELILGRGSNVKYYLEDLSRIKGMFDDGGLLTSQEANVLRGISTVLVRQGENASNNKPFSKVAKDWDKVANDIDEIVNAHDINNNERPKEILEEFYSYDGGVNYLKGKIDKNNKEIKDREGYIKDSINEQQYWEKVGKDLEEEKKLTQRAYDKARGK